MILDYKFRKENSNVEEYDVNVDGQQMDIMLKCILIARGYNKKIAKKGEEIVLSNGKSTIIINEKYNYIVNEYFENDNIISKGVLFPSVYYDGIRFAEGAPAMRRLLELLAVRGGLLKKEYNYVEFFRQVFSYDNKVATISLIVKMGTKKRLGLDDDSVFEPSCPVLRTFYDHTAFYAIAISYYDSVNSEILSLNIDVIDKFDNKLVDELSFLNNKPYIYPDDIDNISVGFTRYDNYIEVSPGRAYDGVTEHIDKVVKGLNVAYKKVEKYLGTELEKSDTLNSKIKRRSKTIEIVKKIK